MPLPVSLTCDPPGMMLSGTSRRSMFRTHRYLTHDESDADPQGGHQVRHTGQATARRGRGSAICLYQRRIMRQRQHICQGDIADLYGCAGYACAGYAVLERTQ